MSEPQATTAMTEKTKQAIKETLDYIGIQGATFEEQVTEFKKQHWVDAKIGKGYLEDLLKTEPQKDNAELKALLEHVSKQKPPVVEVKDLSEAQQKVLTDALRKNNNIPQGESIALEDLIKRDKNESKLYPKADGSLGTWVDATIPLGKDGLISNSTVIVKMEEVRDRVTNEKRSAALENLHTEIGELQAKIKSGSATPKDYEEAEAARKAARAFFEKEESDPKKVNENFAKAYEAKFGAKAVEEARNTWKDRSMAFANEMRSENFDAAKVAAIVDVDGDGKINGTEAKKIESLVNQAMRYNRHDLAPATPDDHQNYSADVKQAEVVLQNQNKLQAAITAFQKTGVYGGEQVNAAPHEVQSQANNAGKARQTTTGTPD